MVSCGPYTQSYNFTHMFNQVDLRGLPKKDEYTPGSMMYLLSTNPSFSKFGEIVKRAGFDGYMNDPQSNYTLFVPNNDSFRFFDKNFTKNIDRSLAIHLVKSLTLNNKITSDILTDSPAAYYTTRDSPNRLFITNVNGLTQISNCSEAYGCERADVIEMDVLCNNGIIHVIDRLLSCYSL